jgi:predicted O-methyltransferase YrrM
VKEILMNRRHFLALLATAPAVRAATTNDDIRKHLAAMRAAQKGNMNVDPPEGEYFYSLVKRLNAKRVLEIGTSNGYSGIWFAMGLRETGGKLITLEIDKGRYDLAQANFKITELAPYIDSRLTDAKVEAARVPGPLDIVFIDAWKPDYLAYYEAVLPKVRKGGVILAHNVVSHPGQMQNFLARIKSDPAVRTEIRTIGPQGLSISTKL